jgi:hypothetical protein
VTAVIETGNHIAQLPDGRLRRQYADKLATLLKLVIDGNAPWVLHTVERGPDFLRTLIDGAGTGIPLSDQVMRKLGLGDLRLLAERELYTRRVSGVEAGIWTLDDQLRSHA